MMEFNSDGGIFSLQMQLHGLWEVRIPWQVAIEGWKRETGRDTSGKDDLKRWLETNTLRFSDMVAARADDRLPATEPDDQRVMAVRIDRP